MAPTEYLEPQPRPEVNVLVVSLVLFFTYMISSAVVALGLSAAGMALHPLTRMFIWLVVTASVGFSLLRQHHVYPTRLRLGIILTLTIMYILFMSMSIILRLGDDSLAPDMSVSIALDMLVNTVSLFSIGAFALWAANWAYERTLGRR